MEDSVNVTIGNIAKQRIITNLFDNIRYDLLNLLFVGMINKTEREKFWLLDGSDFLKVNKRLLKNFDFETAIFITALIKQEIYNFQKGRLNDKGMFLLKREYVEKNFYLSKKQQWRISKQLEERNLIKAVRKGQPPCTWISVNHSLLNLAVGNVDFNSYDLENE